MAIEADDASDTLTSGATEGCFLCSPGLPPCAVASSEGRLREVWARDRRDGASAMRIETADGALVTIHLNEQARGLARALAAIPAGRWRGAHIRFFHLAPNLAADVEPHTTDGNLRLLPGGAAIFEPDLLLNITDINNAEYCVRQYPLRRMTPSPPTLPTLRGSAIHQAFQGMLKSDDPTSETHLRHAFAGQIEDFALRQVSVQQATEEAEPHLRALAAWYTAQRQNLWATVPRIRAETFLLAPEVGLRGRLDFLLEDAHGDSLLELKTGAARTGLPKREHRWQVYGYQTLLTVRRRHDASRPQATLLYSGAPDKAESYGIPFTPRDLHRVLELRNALAITHVTASVPLPPGARVCGRCFVRQSCARASALLGWEPPPIEEAADQPLPADATQFAAYHEMLRLEARAAEEEGAQLWRMTPAERCAAGFALGNLRLVAEPTRDEKGEWTSTFVGGQASELRQGDAILLSDGDPIHGEVANGAILAISDQQVIVWTRERVANPRLIDRYGSDVVHDRTVRNLWRWLDVDARLRSLARSELAPTFATDGPALTLPPSFNAEQRRAIERAMAAQDFFLVQGPPGTGKTSVVAEIAWQAVARGERVLVAAFTNQAVDNVLRRLVDQGLVDFIRLGKDLSVADDLHRYRLSPRAHAHAAALSLEPGGVAQDTVAPEVVREVFLRAPLIATTAATWSSERYDEAGEPLRFDLALVDEATQLTVPALLGVLRFARRFVLIGDERQLPPLVLSPEAAAHGLKRSLFAELLERWGASASVRLTRQYRMHPLICGFPSAAFYDGELVTAGAALTATLECAISADEPGFAALDPARPLVFVDVDAQERPGKASPAQANTVRALIVALRKAGVAPDEIGVIAPYRAQVALIRARLASVGEDEVAVDTVDRFQGAERHVMLLSFGGEAPEGVYTRGLDFLADEHRLNVALTRAQRKLIIVGARRHLEHAPILWRLLAYCGGLYGGRGGVVTAQMRESDMKRV